MRADTFQSFYTTHRVSVLAKRKSVTDVDHATAPFLVAMSREVDPKRFGIEVVRFISLVIDNLQKREIQLLKNTRVIYQGNFEIQ